MKKKLTNYQEGNGSNLNGVEERITRKEYKLDLSPQYDFEIKIRYDYPVDEEVGLYSLTRGTLYSEGDYCYYDRAYTLCSDTYYSVFRFDLSEIFKVFRFLSDNDMSEFEGFLHGLKGYEWISFEHSI